MPNQLPAPGEWSHSSDLDSARRTACQIVDDVWNIRSWAELHPDANDEAEETADKEADSQAYRLVRGLLYGCPELDYHLRQFGELFAGALPHIESFGVDAPSYHTIAFWLGVTVLNASGVARDQNGFYVLPPDESGRITFQTSALGRIKKAPYKDRFKNLIRAWIPSFNGRRLCAWIAKESARVKQSAAQAEWARRPSDTARRADALLRAVEAFLWVKNLDEDFDQAAAKLGREVQSVKEDYDAGAELLHQVSKFLGGKQFPAIEASGSVDALQPPDTAAVCESKRVKLFGPGEQPEVNGKRKTTLTKARYDAIKALIEAGENGLTKDELVNRSKHTDAVNSLKALAKKDRDWKRVLQFAGATGKRHRIK